MASAQETSEACFPFLYRLLTYALRKEQLLLLYPSWLSRPYPSLCFLGAFFPHPCFPLSLGWLFMMRGLAYWAPVGGSRSPGGWLDFRRMKRHLLVVSPMLVIKQMYVCEAMSCCAVRNLEERAPFDLETRCITVHASRHCTYC